MRKLFGFFSVALFFVCFVATSCSEGESYAEMKEKERDAINAFIVDNDIKVIGYNEFIDNGCVTDTATNEYVLFSDNGVYMQIVRNPIEEGIKMEDGDRKKILARYYEYNIQDGDTLTSNLYDTSTPDVFTISCSNGNYSASFTSGYMYSYYGSTVPSGWLVPFPYIYLTRYQSKIAKVNLIVPHSEGTSTATSYVYPCFYQITFQPTAN